MIYEGAVIRRLVTPNHPGDPKLDDPTAEIQCRVEYVRDDATAPAPGSWTREFAEAHRYPRHLAADDRAKEIGGNCFARVVTRDSDERGVPSAEFQDLSGGAERLAGAKPDSQRRSAGIVVDGAHQCGVNKSEDSDSPAHNNLPAEGSSSGRALKQLPSVVPKVEVVETKDKRSRGAGKSFSKRGRLAALRAAKARIDDGESRLAVPSDHAWWREGQYA